MPFPWEGALLVSAVSSFKVSWSTFTSICSDFSLVSRALIMSCTKSTRDACRFRGTNISVVWNASFGLKHQIWHGPVRISTHLVLSRKYSGMRREGTCSCILLSLLDDGSTQGIKVLLQSVLRRNQNCNLLQSWWNDWKRKGRVFSCGNTIWQVSSKMRTLCVGSLCDQASALPFSRNFVFPRKEGLVTTANAALAFSMKVLSPASTHVDSIPKAQFAIVSRVSRCSALQNNPYFQAIWFVIGRAQLTQALQMKILRVLWFCRSRGGCTYAWMLNGFPSQCCPNSVVKLSTQWFTRGDIWRMSMARGNEKDRSTSRKSTDI